MTVRLATARDRAATAASRSVASTTAHPMLGGEVEQLTPSLQDQASPPRSSMIRETTAVTGVSPGVQAVEQDVGRHVEHHADVRRSRLGRGRLEPLDLAPASR